jgi:gliding motility-associated-like protein
MNKMRLKKFLASLVLMMALWGGKANASHIAALDIYYTYVSPLVYEVHLIIYNDCSGITPGWTQGLQYSSATLAVCQNITLDTNGVGEPQAATNTNFCPNTPNNCNTLGSSNVAFARYHFKGQVTLPAVAKDWVFKWTTCCRNTNGNLIDANSTIEATLNNVDRPVNNSPILTERPIPSVCLNKVSQFLNAPVDPDNDSVVIKAAEPLGASGGCGQSSGTGFVAPYNLTYPFPIAPAFWNVDSISGAVCFTPTTQNEYVVAFKAFDIDRLSGDTLGTIMRDVQFIVGNCFASPIISCDTVANGGLLAATNNVTVCPGELVTFRDTGVSLSLANLLTVSCNNALTAPGSTFVPDAPFGYGSLACTFSWVPTAADAGSHAVIIKYVDSTCNASNPFMFPVYKIYQITVLDGVSVPPFYNYCLDGDSINLTAIGPPSMGTWSWTVIPQALPPGATANFATPNLKQTLAAPTQSMYIAVQGFPAIGNCPDKDTTYVNVYPAITINQANSPYNPCSNEPVQINLVPNQPGGVWNWTPSTYLNTITAANPVCTPIVPTTYTVTYQSVNGCKKTIDVPVTTKGIKPILSAAAEKNPVCANEAFNIISNASSQPCGVSAIPSLPAAPITPVAGSEQIINPLVSPFIRGIEAGYRSQYLFTAKELKQIGLKPGNIRGLFFNVFSDNAGASEDTLLQLKIKMGCTQYQQLSSSVGFVPGLTEVYSKNKYAPILNQNTFNFTNNMSYFWDGNSNLVVEVCYNLPTFVGSTTAEVYCSNTNFNSVINAQDFNANGCSINAPFTYNIASVRPNTGFVFSEVAPLTYQWTPSNLFLSAAAQDGLVKNGINNNTTFTLVSYGGDPSCASTTTVPVTVDFAGSIVGTASNTNLCEPGLTTLQATPTAVSPTFDCGATNYTTIAPPSVRNIPGSTSPVNGSQISSLFPFYHYNSRTQFIVTAADIAASGMGNNPHLIDQIALTITTKYTNAPFIGYTVKLACISPAELELGSFKNVPMTTVFTSPSYNTIAGSNIFTCNPKYLWNGRDNLLVEICYDDYAGTNFQGDAVQMTTGTYPVNVSYNSYTWAGGSGCNLPNTTSNNLGYPFRPKIDFVATPTDQRPFEYLWTPSLYVYDSSIQNTLAYVPATTIYTVGLINNNGCKRYDTVRVRIIEHDVEVSPEDTMVCPGDNFYAFVTGFGDGVQPTYQWSPTIGLDCPTCTLVYVNTAALAQGQNQVYDIVRTDEFGCKDTTALDVGVRFPPQVQITNGDSITVPYNTQVNLIATGSQTYSWSPSWAVSNPNVASTIIQPTASTLYYVYGVDSASCVGKDSIYVTVDVTNPVVAPTAFSPNNDGVNDRFVLWNQRFENVQTFKVMNRWGQEVYNASNSNTGWDGTYKGQPCDMDTYYYVIRVAYPDGNTKEFKGEVLLMR